MLGYYWFKIVSIKNTTSSAEILIHRHESGSAGCFFMMTKG